MTNWQHLLLAAAMLLLGSALVYSAAHRSSQRKKQDFTRKLETLLQQKESVQVICPQRRGCCVLTNNRLIFEKKGKFQAFAIKSIQRIQGYTKEGKRTTVPAKMDNVMIRMEKEHILYHSGPEFEKLIGQLQKICTKQKKSKTEK